MRTIIAALLTILFCSTSHGIAVLNVKNNRVLLDMEGDSLRIGDRLGARDSSGKARALLEVRQVKGGKAIAEVVRGQMDRSYFVTAMGASGGASANASSGSRSQPRSSRSGGGGKSKWGVMAGYAMNTMNVKHPNGFTASMSGSSFNFGGMYQLTVGGNIHARVVGGYESLTVSGTGGGNNYATEIGYIGGEALVQYYFMKGRSMDLWAGAGLGFLFAMNKQSNILDANKISTNQTVVGSLGLDYKLSGNSFIPVQFDYAFYPDNSASATTQMIFRFGYGFSF